MFITFYSFKGGVGRSMALANLAEIFSRQQLRVLLVDFDLEAPGLERYFEDSDAAINANEIQEKRGIIDLLESYKELRLLAAAQSPSEAASFPVEPLSSFVVPLYPSSSERKSVSLIPAGRRGLQHFAEYARRVRAFDWDDFYARRDGEAFFEWFRKEAESISEVVLVDARTGVSEMSGVCTYQLADSVAMFVAPNKQNLLGVQMMAEALADSRLIEHVRHGRPLTMVSIPSRVEQSEAALLDEFAKEFNGLFGKISPAGMAFEKDAFSDLKIPYVPYYSYMERVAVRETARASAADLVAAYERIGRALAQATPDTPTFAKFKELASAPRARGPAAPSPRPVTPIASRTSLSAESREGQYDIFISYSRADRPWAMKFSESLSAFGLRVFIDSSRLVSGEAWEPVLVETLRRSRNLLMLDSESAGTSDWVQRELGWFRSFISNDPQQRRLLIVNLGGRGRADLSEFQAIDTIRAAGYDTPNRVDDRTWSNVIESIVHAVANVTAIPLAVIAMTEPDLQLLDALGSIRGFGVPLKQLLGELGLSHSAMQASYGTRPGDWRPFGSNQSVESLLADVLQKANASAESDDTRFRWAPVDSATWTDPESARRDASRLLSAPASVLVVDPLSLYHPSSAQVLARLSDCFYNRRSTILVPSPVPPPPGFETLVRAVEERGRPFFDGYFAPWRARGAYATVEANVGTYRDLERLLRRAITVAVADSPIKLGSFLRQDSLRS